MAKYELTFRKERETKNTVRFQEEAEPGKPQIVGTLYIQKWAAPAEKIRVTVAW